VYDTQGPFTVSGTSQSLNYTCNVAGLSSYVYVEISDAGGSAAKGVTSSSTQVTAKPSSITLTYPSTSVNLARGQTVNVTWNYLGSSPPPLFY
jgi:hypothetical protein